jgi:hypothetical protein
MKQAYHRMPEPSIAEKQIYPYDIKTALQTIAGLMLLAIYFIIKV